MAQLRKYGAATTIYFPLVDRGTLDFEASPVTHASGDTQYSCDGGNFANTDNAFAHEGNGIYSLLLATDELEGAIVVISIVDSATKTWEDQSVIIETYGHASAQHAMDFDAGLPTNFSSMVIDASGRVDVSLAEGTDFTDQINAAMDAALNTAIPGSPTANSINQRIVALDDLTQAAGGGDLAGILALVNVSQTLTATPGGAAKFTGADSSGIIDSDTAVMDVPGYLVAAVLIGNGAAAATLTLHDHASSASGTEVCYMAATTTNRTATFSTGVPVVCSNGIYADIEGSGAKALVVYAVT